MFKMKRKVSICRVFTILLIVIAAYLSFFNLNGSYLWKDEAHTAFIAENILEYGVPKVWDGQNLITGTEGNDFNQSFVLISKGWFQFYFVAISFAIFGVNTFAARFPFALAGFLTIILNYVLAKRIFKKDSLATATLFYNIVCVQFVLYIRTCRDYAATMFFISVTTVLLYEIFDKGKKESSTLCINIILDLCSIISFVCLFYSNHLFGGIYCVSIICYVILFEKTFVRRVMVIVGGGILFWIPWYIYTSHSGVPAAYAISNNIVDRFLIGLWKVQTYFFPFLTIIALLFVMNLIPARKIRHIAIPKENLFFVILIAVNVIVVSFVEFFIVNHYFLAVAVATPFLMTVVTMKIFEKSRMLVIPFVIIVSFTNVMNIAPFSILRGQNINTNIEAQTYGNQFSEPTCLGIIASPYTEGDGSIRSLQKYLSDIEVKFYFADLLYEIQYGYEGVNKEIVNYLNEVGKDNDIVLYAGAEPEPIAFYTNMKLIRTLSEKVNVFEEYFSEYPNKKYSYLVESSDEEIDWIILSSYGRDLLLEDPKYIEMNRDKFQVYQTKSIDMFLSNSPDLDYHRFKPEYEGPKVIILKKK